MYRCASAAHGSHTTSLLAVFFTVSPEKLPFPSLIALSVPGYRLENRAGGQTGGDDLGSRALPGVCMQPKAAAADRQPLSDSIVSSTAVAVLTVQAIAFDNPCPVRL